MGEEIRDIGIEMRFEKKAVKMHEIIETMTCSTFLVGVGVAFRRLYIGVHGSKVRVSILS